MAERKMGIREYFESVYTAYAEDDTDKVEELATTQGMQDIKMKDVEELCSYVIQILGSTHQGLVQKEQAHFDILLGGLTKVVEYIDTPELNGIIDTMKDLDDQMNKILDSNEDGESESEEE